VPFSKNFSGTTQGGQAPPAAAGPGQASSSSEGRAGPAPLPNRAAEAPPHGSNAVSQTFFHTPFLKALNLSIAVLLVAVVAAVYWFGWRTLPETSGTIAAPISARATVARDARGAPHITAASWEDAVLLQGYTTAQDRMWQMDALRRLAAGELAEVLGRGAMDSILDSDREARRWRLARIAEEQARNLTPDARSILSAYARGVNYWMETHRRRLPPEFALLGYDPRPWRIEDSLLVALEMGRTLTSTWRAKMDKLHMLEGGDAAKVDFLYPRGAGGEIQPGSNAWVISAAHSATGKPILANDPHLQWSIPSAWYLIHLRAPDLDVTGASLPGVPTVIIGHNRRIAWGVTNLGYDVQELYREQIDLQSGRYIYQGRAEQARPERDVIAVKGAPPAPANLWVTRHGPVFLTEGNQSYSMRWLPAEDGALDFPFLSLDRARNWAEFNAALARFAGPPQNFVYADVDGNIGYHAAGHLPVRPANCPADAPADGASGECEWQGVIPYDRLPQVFNPPSGMIVTANQNPFPKDFGWPVDGRFAPRYRAQEIRALLQSRGRWTAGEMLAIQKDVYSAFSRFLAGQIVAASEKRPPSDAALQRAVASLRSWNGQMETTDAAPMIVTLAYDELRRQVAERASPRHADAYESSLVAPEVLERLLRERPAGWFSDYDALVLKSLADGLARGRRLQGSNVSRWNYGRYNQLKIENPVLGRLPLLGEYFDIGPVAMSGSPTTIKQDSVRLGPSMRMAIDFADFDRSLQNITTGESGHPLSRHYMDQWPAYYVGRSFPMEFNKAEAKQTLTVNPE
jgi:penicillin G amidase